MLIRQYVTPYACMIDIKLDVIGIEPNGVFQV